jgi:hypothetical protein
MLSDCASIMFSWLGRRVTDKLTLTEVYARQYGNNGRIIIPAIDFAINR